MSTTSKSPRKVALTGGEEAIRPYTHKFSPKKFTQPQLLTCLVLKMFLGTDYRGVVAILKECLDLWRKGVILLFWEVLDLRDRLRTNHCLQHYIARGTALS